MNTEAAKNFIINNARPLEMALYRYFMETGLRKLFSRSLQSTRTLTEALGMVRKLTIGIATAAQLLL